MVNCKQCRKVLLSLAAFVIVSIASSGLFTGDANAQRRVSINEKGFDVSRTCATCHSDINARWKDSMHARAVSDPIFRASFMEAHYLSGGKASEECLRCHAPTTKITKAFKLDDVPTTEGITCDFCHSVSGLTGKPHDPFKLDLGTTKYGPNKKGSVKQHKVAYSPIHAKSEFCATCHEFSANGISIMSTYSEWKESVYADENRPCQSCHMPEVKGQIANNVKSERGEKIFSHDLAGAHSMQQLQKALALKIVRVGRKKDRMSVAVDLTNVGSGHRVPTGIPTRKLVLYCEVRAPGGKVYKEKVTYEKVIFDKDGKELTSDAAIMLGHGSVVAEDNRIYPKETRREIFTFYIPSSQRAEVSVWVDYLYSPRIMQETEMRIEMTRDMKVSGN